MDKKFWTEGPGSFAIAIGIALTIRWAFMEAYVIPSASMLPTLLINDHIFVNKMVYGVRVPFTEKWLYRANNPQRGEVIVFKYPEDNTTAYIKRVIGIPGDKVFYENGKLYINDQVQEVHPAEVRKSDFDWLTDKDFHGQPGERFEYSHMEETIGDQTFSILLKKNRGNQVFGPYYVPENHYFVMGDNRDNSADGRFWREKRFVPHGNLIGRAMFVWLSCDETLPVISFLCNPLELRWSRFFHNVHE